MQSAMAHLQRDAVDDDRTVKSESDIDHIHARTHHGKARRATAVI